jgi:hypothetical protein
MFTLVGPLSRAARGAEHRRKMVVLVRKDDAFDAPGAAFDRISDRL